MAQSPPLTPIRDYMSPIDTSPANSYREQLRRRNSSFSSNHDRSPITPRSKHRFSNASTYSNEPPTPHDDFGGSGGMGNLADELDQLSDEEYIEGVTEESIDCEGDLQEDAADGARDSGIDVSYTANKRSLPAQKPTNFSKPFALRSEKPPDERQEDEEKKEEPFTPELEDAMNAITRLAAYADATPDPLVPRFFTQLQDLGNQSALETGSQRLTTSTNSLASHLTKETRSLQALAASLYSPFYASLQPPQLEAEDIDELIPALEILITQLPHPDPAPMTGIQKLSHETKDLIQTLAELTDTLQMGKQMTNTASRHLRTTQGMVADLRREKERADTARDELKASPWGDKVKERWCAGECRDVLEGFEAVCQRVREDIESAWA